MKFFIIPMICLFFSGCSADRNFQGYRATPESIERERLCNILTSKVAIKLMKEKGLLPCGFGGQTSNGVQMLALSFDYRFATNMEIGRELLISAVQEFISFVNAEKRIQKYLNNYPFAPKNVEIRIFLKTPEGNCKDEGLRVISIIDGILEYDTRGPSGNLETFFRETYEEALLKLETSKNSRTDDLQYEIAI